MTDGGDGVVTVRIADLDDPLDRAALTALRIAWVAERRGLGDDGTFAAEMDAWLAAEAGRRIFWLAVAPDGTPAGMVNLVDFDRMPGPGGATGGWGYLGNMFVVAGLRNGGLGRRMLDVVVAEAAARGYERVVLSPSERSIPFYRRGGFEPAEQLLVIRP